MTTTPIAWNLRRVAYHIKYELCNMLFLGDSTQSQETDSRRPVGIVYAWRPAIVRGISWPGGGQVSSTSSAGAGGDPVGEVGPTYNGDWYVGSSSKCNRYDLASRTWQLAQQNATFDAASPAGSPVYSVSPGISPVTYREQQWAADPGASALVIKFTALGAVLAKFAGGDPFNNKSVTGRIIGYKNTNGVTMQIQAVKGSSSAVTNMNFNGAAGYVVGERTFPTAATANMQMLMYTASGASGITPGANPITIIGNSWFTGDSTGFLPAWWCNSGWNSETFVDTALVSDASLEMWLSATLGNGLGSASPSATNGPTLVRICLGENQTAAETAELDAGVSTTFKANIRAVVARVRARCAALGTQPMLWFEAPYGTVKSATNNLTMSQAKFELAQEYGGAFTDGYQIQPPYTARIMGRLAAGGIVLDERLTPDGIHPQFQGAVAMEAADWALLENALILQPSRSP